AMDGGRAAPSTRAAMMPVRVPSGQRLARLDRYLESAVRDRLAHDDRVRGLDVRAEFAGGVAHLTGKVGSPAQLATVRALIGELAGVFAVWSRVRVAGVAPVLLDLGCGATKQYAESIGLDRRRTGAVDVLADAGRGLPFR